MMHRFLSRSDALAGVRCCATRGGTRLRVGGATRWMISSLRSDEGGVGAVENLCIVRANPANELL